MGCSSENVVVASPQLRSVQVVAPVPVAAAAAPAPVEAPASVLPLAHFQSVGRGVLCCVAMRGDGNYSIYPTTPQVYCRLAPKIKRL